MTHAFADRFATVSKGIASLNHYSKGAMVSWLFDTVCGIRVAGENHFVIAPRPGGTLTYSKAGYDSVYGRVESSWRKEDGKQILDLSVPSNCTADVVLPNGQTNAVVSGRYRFEIV